MRCAILIIGSLLWDSEPRRKDWREKRLDVSERTPVRAPIYYGRKSEKRGNTFTMVFGSSEPSGQAVLVPCKKQIETVDDLVEEANALWQAEDASAASGCFHKSWGCVGVLFREATESAALRKAWVNHFGEKRARPISVIDSNGQLGIAWPSNIDGRPVGHDLILATATKPVTERPSAHVIADAWLAQQAGRENYFFMNVQNGIRTLDDIEIWRRIEQLSPRWLNTEAYREAVKILTAESKGQNFASRA